MSNRKLAKAVQVLFRQIGRLYRTLSKALVTWLLRTAFVMSRRDRRATSAGFVLPTTVLLILVVSLTAGALTFRAFNTSTRTIGEVQNRIIYNAATPAVDRARAKLEYLFDANKDPRYPGGVPSEDILMSMLLNQSTNVRRGGNFPAFQGGGNPYQLPDETPLDINGDGNLDTAWYYEADTDGDGTKDATVVYSIIFATPPSDTTPDPDVPGWQRLVGLRDVEKASGRVNGNGAVIDGNNANRTISYTRSGPLNQGTAVQCDRSDGKVKVEQGWYEDPTNTAVLRKNFQVDALVIPKTTRDGGANNFATLEFQQDRKLDRGNKWGAWFRNDLEIFPGSQFQWNGAMHTEGSLFIGGNGPFEAHLISSPKSCLFNEAASEITVTSTVDPTLGTDFKGAIASGTVRANSYVDSNHVIYRHSSTPINSAETLRTSNDWVTDASQPPFSFTLDPKAIVTRNGYVSRRTGDTTNIPYRSDQPNAFTKRFKTKAQAAPYVDDLYRADNRYGPKSRYKLGNASDATIPQGTATGSPIVGLPSLTGNNPGAGEEASQVGLDGYWERRARNEGMRILVGERLQLGNTNGWVTPKDLPDLAALAASNNIDREMRNTTPVGGNGLTPPTDPNADPDVSDDEGDPLYPAYQLPSDRAHEALQRRALRDNLAAVQGAAIYHKSIDGGDFPVACLASTSHPGTPFTLRQSLNFVPSKFLDGSGSATEVTLLTDFFSGRGTNGWEFAPPMGSLANFTTEINSASSPLRKGLANLAYFSGDHIDNTRTGAFPPTQSTTVGEVHPFPTLTMWGNYSNLRRTLADLNNGTTYTDLSPADKTYLHTAACTLGMLAYNVNQVQKFNPRAANDVPYGNGSAIVSDLGQQLFTLIDGNVDNGEVLPKERLATYNYSAGGTLDQAKYSARDYDRVGPEEYIAKLRQANPDGKLTRLAEIIFEDAQIQRDRAYGFRASPAANTWNFNPYVATFNQKATLWSSACDPNMFALQNKLAAQPAGPVNPATIATPTERAARLRLGLSRLCGAVIPPGATRFYPGDQNYPARNDSTAPSNTAATNLNKYLPHTSADEPPSDPSLRPIPNPETTSLVGQIQLFFRSLAGTTNDSEQLRVATVSPKWPSLYYLFPEVDHLLNGEIAGAPGNWLNHVDHRQPNGAIPGLIAAYQPWTEPYVTHPYNTTANGTVQFRTVGSAAATIGQADYTTAEFTFTDPASGQPLKQTYRAYNSKVTADSPIDSLALPPRDLPTSSTAGIGSGFTALGISNETWKLPVGKLTGTPPQQNTPPNRITVPDGTGTATAVIPFLDRVFFDGRENLPVRVMDIDLGMLRRTTPVPAEPDPDDKEAWLPKSGIVYAFREDGVREDAISRPAAGTTTNSTDPGNPTDPPLEQVYSGNANPKISVKAVDFVPDADRRPYGFRLRNGSQLQRDRSLGIPVDDNIRGLSFFTDNPVYILGHFNLHQQSGTDNDALNDENLRLEEFEGANRLVPNRAYTPEEFYNREGADDKFADVYATASADSPDRWRPSEILADSITILSESFCDGSIEDTFASAPVNATQPDTATVADAGNKYNSGVLERERSGCGNNKTSFLNQNMPTGNLATGQRWQREIPTDPNSPVKISRNGNGLLQATANGPKPKVATDYSGGYLPYSPTKRAVQTAADSGTRVNAVIVSGSVPSRINQSYGGLHNFPRMLEFWSSARPLWFSGSFLQLSFSNYATSPYDLDAVEPGDATDGGDDFIPYYQPPRRAWGYDVGLQFAPAGPAAARFVEPGRDRNEFYNEPAANDPYIQNLCKSLPDTTFPDNRCPA